MDLATYMVDAGLRAGPPGLRKNRELADHVAGDSARERQRFVLGAIYPSMFFLTLPSAVLGASVSFLADGGVWIDAVGLAIVFVPASVMLAVYVKSFVDRIRGADPAALILTSEGRRALPGLSAIGYLIASVLGVVAAFTWARA